MLLCWEIFCYPHPIHVGIARNLYPHLYVQNKNVSAYCPYLPLGWWSQSMQYGKESKGINTERKEEQSLSVGNVTIYVKSYGIHRNSRNISECNKITKSDIVT